MTQSVIKYVDGDVLKHKCTRNTLMIHVNNDCGGFGSGFVVPLGKKYPEVKDAYLEWYQTTTWDDDEFDITIPFVLGRIQQIKVSDSLRVINMIAQSQPGGCTINIAEEKVYVRPIRLECLRECLLRVAALAKILDAEVIGPAFGGGLAGADFKKEIEPIIKECLCDFNINTTIYLLK